MTRHAFLSLALACLAFPACGRKKAPPFDPAPYETPAVAATLRHVLNEAKEAGVAAKVGIIVFGGKMHDSTPAFRAQFADTGIDWHEGKDMTQVWVGPIARVIERKSKLQPVQLQVSGVELREPGQPGGPQEITAAWAFEDRMMRRRYAATPGENGAWKIEPREIVEQKPAPQL